MVGTGRWKGFATWPPEGSRAERLWLTSKSGLSHVAPPDAQRGASSAQGSKSSMQHGTSRAQQGAGSVLAYQYDPADPTPACGGPAFNPLNSGERNQRSVERRADVLVFTSAPLRRRLAVVGHVRLRMRAASTAHSVDFIARLCEVSPLTGSATNICEGVVRLHAQPAADPTTRVGGDDGIQVTVELGPIGVEFSAGSRVRVHVCSAAHPRWMRNLNNEHTTPLAEHTCGHSSTQRVWVDCLSSYLELPVDSV
jgi:putative CocE/NonD family hydrolase